MSINFNAYDFGPEIGQKVEDLVAVIDDFNSKIDKLTATVTKLTDAIKAGSAGASGGLSPQQVTDVSTKLDGVQSSLDAAFAALGMPADGGGAPPPGDGTVTGGTVTPPPPGPTDTTSPPPPPPPGPISPPTAPAAPRR